MDGTPSLNIEYIIAQLYAAISGIHFDVNSVPRQFIIITGMVTIAGMVIATLVFIAVIYLLIRTVQIEHAGYRHFEEEEKRRQVHTKKLGVDSRWDAIVALASSPNEGDWRRAIVDADVMLNELLTARGYPGDTLGDQLKAANPLQFTTINQAWEAHKMRNAIAHLGEAFPLTERDTHATIDLYRRVFEEFGII